MWRDRNSCIHQWERKWWNCYRKEWRFFKGVKTRTTTRSSSSTWGVLHPKELKAGSWRDRTPLFTASTHSSQEAGSTAVFVGGWIRSAVWLQRRSTQPLKGRKPCDLGNKHRSRMCTACFPLCEASKAARLVGTESRTVTTKKRGRGEKAYRASDLRDKPRDLFHNHVHTLNTTDPHTWKQLRWQILCSVFFAYPNKKLKMLKPL